MKLCKLILMKRCWLHFLSAKAELSTTREELESRSNELSHIKSELQTANDQLAEVKAELGEEKKVNAHLRLENSSLRKRVVSEQTLSNNDKMVKYYTRLPSFDLLKAIYERGQQTCSLFSLMIVVFRCS